MADLIAVREQTVVEQVAAHVRDLIVRGRLPRGAVLPTYRELAEQLDVGYTTVKLGMDLLAEQGIINRTRRRGCMVLKELALQPRPLDRVGVVYAATRRSFFCSPYLHAIMSGVADALPGRGDLHVFSIRDDGLVSAAGLGEGRIDGAILLSIENDDYLRAFAAWGTPGVVVDYAPSPDVPLDYVACDNAAAMRQLVNLLARHGHRCVGYVTLSGPRRNVVDPRDHSRVLFERDSSDERERCEETLRALREHGIESICVPPLEFGRGAAAIVTDRAVALMQTAGARRPTAFVAVGGELAVTLVSTLRAAGFRVPEDVSVCAIGELAEASQPERQSLTACNFDFAAMGRMAAECLMARCQRPQEAGAPHGRRVGFVFNQGSTVGSVPA